MIQPYVPLSRSLRWYPFGSLAFGVFSAARLLWWLVRGSAYGIGLCLHGQLRVPAEGWRAIGRWMADQYRQGEPLVIAVPIMLLLFYVLLLIRF